MKKRFLFVLMFVIVVTLTWAGGSGEVLRDTGASATKLTRTSGEVYPNRQIELIIPLSAGGGADIFCRQIAVAFQKVTGVPLVVNNITGASGLRGIGTAMNARPDGYTLVAFNPPSQPLSQMMTDPGFDMRQLSPIVYYTYDANLLLVHPSVPYKTFPELVDAYKSGRISTIGCAAKLDLIGLMLLKDRAGLAYKTMIEYAGSGDSLAAILRHEVDVVVASAGSSLDQIRDGGVKPIMIMTYDRYPVLPDLPAYGEYMKNDNIDAASQLNRIICGPPGLPEDILNYLEGVFLKSLKDPDLVKWAIDRNQPILDAGRSEARRVLDVSFELPKMINFEELLE